MGFIKTVIASAIGTVIGLFSFSFMALVFLTMLIIGLSTATSLRERQVRIEDKSILTITVEGSLVERRQPVDFIEDLIYKEQSHDIGLYELGRVLEKAAKDKKIAAVYLRLKWVEGGWAKVEAFREMIKKFRQSKKPVIAYSEGYDEKLYYLATAASEINLYPKGDFEWNGIYSKSMFFKKTLAKLEVEPQLIRAGRFKSAGETVTNEKMSDENRQQITELTSGLWARIVDDIVKDRPQVTAEELNSMAQNLTVTTASQAFNSKLVDQLAPIEEIEKRMHKISSSDEKKDPRLVTWYTYYQTLSDSKKEKNEIAVIMAEGEIHSGKGSDPHAIYSDEMSSLIRDLAKDDDVKAVVLRVNSPGGSALASDVIWRSLEYLKAKKKLVTSFSDVAASGGYYISAGSDYIFAEPTTVTGSIGVFGLMFNAQKFFDDKLGITFDEVKTHTSSDLMTGTRSLTPFEHQRIQMDVNTTYKTFLNVVKQGRKSFGSEEDVDEIAEGRVWLGAKAKEIGLVDELGSLDQAVAKAAELAKLKNYSTVVYPDQKKFFDQFLETFNQMWLPPQIQKALAWLKPQTQTVIYTRAPYDWSF